MFNEIHMATDHSVCPDVQAIRQKHEQRTDFRGNNNLTDVDVNVTNFDITGFPDYIQRFIQDTAVFNSIEENSVAVAVLQTLAMSMGANSFFDLNNPEGEYIFQHETLNLYSLIIAPSGAGKTHLFHTVLNEINVFEKELRMDYKKAKKEWEKEGRKTPEPNDFGIMINNLTVEGLLRQVADNCNEQSEMTLPVMMSTDEASGFLSKLSDLGKFHDAKSFFCNAWDGKSYSSTRKSEKFYVDRILFHFLGAIQNARFQSVLNENADFIDQGLIYRFLIYQDKTSQINSTKGKRRDKRSAERFHNLICSKLRDSQKTYYFTNEATNAFDEYAEKVREYANKHFEDGHAVSMLMKIRLITARIAVVFAGSNNHEHVELSDVLSAIKVANFNIHNAFGIIEDYRKGQDKTQSLYDCQLGDLIDAFLNRCVTPERRNELTNAEICRFLGHNKNYITKERNKAK